MRRWFAERTTTFSHAENRYPRLGGTGRVCGSQFKSFSSVMATLNIIVNDASRVVPEGTTVESLLEILGLKPRFLAVERNRQVVPRGDHAATVLADGDRIEIVTLVGGG